MGHLTADQMVFHAMKRSRWPFQPFCKRQRPLHEERRKATGHVQYIGAGADIALPAEV